MGWDKTTLVIKNKIDTKKFEEGGPALVTGWLVKRFMKVHARLAKTTLSTVKKKDTKKKKKGIHSSTLHKC